MGQHKARKILARDKARTTLEAMREDIDLALGHIDDEVPDLESLAQHFADVVGAVHDYGTAYAVAAEDE